MHKTARIASDHMVKNNFAFSLIEIIVVTAIIAVVTSMGFANFHRQQSDEQLKAETRKMADMIGLARKKATVNDTSSCISDFFHPNNKIKKYEFKIESSSTYKVIPDCNDNSSREEISNEIQSSDILITTPAVGSSTFFNSRMTDITPMPIMIKNTSTNRCCQIDINAAGVIKEIPCVTCTPIP